MGICICEVMRRAPPPWGSLFAAMSSSASDTFSPCPASGSASGSASSASLPDDFFDMEEINVDAVPVEERADYVLRAELQRAIALPCFTPHAGRYVQPHVPRLFLEAMMPARLFKKLTSKDTVVMRAVNTRLGVPRRTAAEARDDTTPSRYVASFGTVYRQLQICAPTAEDRGHESAYASTRAWWKAICRMALLRAKAALTCSVAFRGGMGSSWGVCCSRSFQASHFSLCSLGAPSGGSTGGQACTEQNRGGHYASTSVHAFKK